MKSTKIKGITAGAFDLLHAGHLLMLKECKEQCDFLIVLLHIDPTKDRPTKNKPIETLKERMLRLESCKYVDMVIPYMREAELYDILKDAHEKREVDVRFIGEDHKGQPFTGDDLPIKIVYNTRDHDYSSTNLRKRICNQK